MTQEDDARAIETIIRRQFGSLNWTPGVMADWDAFTADFAPEASLYPSARPARSQTPDAFVQRMRGLAASSLPSFRETVLGFSIRCFGNIAMAIVACEMEENKTAISRNVEMMMLVKNEGEWRIVSQAWDAATASRPVPADLLA